MKTIDDARRELHSLTGIKPEKISDFGATVAALLSELVDGLHHWERRSLKRPDWERSFYVEITASLPLATYDNDALTRLVFLAHDYCVRVSVQTSSPRHVRLLFHPRQRAGSIFDRHPTLEDAVATWRHRHPVQS